MFRLSQLFESVGNQVERKRLLTHALKLQRERGSDLEVARTLRHLSETNQQMGLCKTGILLVKEAQEIYERLGVTVEQAKCLMGLARLLHKGGQFDAAEGAAMRGINLLPEKGEQFLVCEFHRVLGHAYQHKGETQKAIHHFEVALGIASPFDWHYHLFWIHYSLAWLFYRGDEFEDACAHIERAKSHTVNSVYYLGYAVETQARIWRRQRRLEEARAEVLRAADIYERLGATKDVEDCRELLRQIEKE